MRNYKIKVVGAAGFELAAPWSQTKCSTKLSYAPDQWATYYVAGQEARPTSE